MRDYSVVCDSCEAEHEGRFLPEGWYRFSKKAAGMNYKHLYYLCPACGDSIVDFLSNSGKGSVITKHDSQLRDAKVTGKPQ
jgi:hypothetical protein